MPNLDGIGALKQIMEFDAKAKAVMITAAGQQNKIIEALKKEPRKEHWIIDGHHRRCPECGEYFCIKDAEGNEIPSSYCPNCGADMIEVEEWQHLKSRQK